MAEQDNKDQYSDKRNQERPATDRIQERNRGSKDSQGRNAEGSRDYIGDRKSDGDRLRKAAELTPKPGKPKK